MLIQRKDKIYKRVIFILVFIILVSLITNCNSANAGLSMSNMPIGSKKYKTIATVDDYITWISIDFGIIGFPLRRPKVHEFTQKHIDENSADALVNIHYWNDRIYILGFVIHRFGMHAEAVKFEKEDGHIEIKKNRR